MKITAMTVITFAVLLSGCEQKANDFVLPGGGKAEITQTNYRCENGESVSVKYINNDQNSIAILDMKDNKNKILTNVIAASGAKYAGGALEWWTKGDSATLTDAFTDSSTECQEGK